MNHPLVLLARDELGLPSLFHARRGIDKRQYDVRYDDDTIDTLRYRHRGVRREIA